MKLKPKIKFDRAFRVSIRHKTAAPTRRERVQALLDLLPGNETDANFLGIMYQAGFPETTAAAQLLHFGCPVLAAAELRRALERMTQ